MITAPASRIIAVADLERSAAFYRVLGFGADGGGTEGMRLNSGLAAIELVRADAAPDSTLRNRPRGHASLFLQVDDLEDVHRRMQDEGLGPSSIERVNWIKYRMFEVRDPDGHVVWLAQSFHEPDRNTVPVAFRQVMPEFPLDDVRRGIDYYVHKLGFSVNYALDDLAVMDRDEARILLVTRPPGRSGVAGCCIYVRDADALHRELVARGALVRGEPVSRPWGLRDFTVVDVEGNEITLAQTFE